MTDNLDPFEIIKKYLNIKFTTRKYFDKEVCIMYISVYALNDIAIYLTQEEYEVLKENLH